MKINAIVFFSQGLPSYSFCAMFQAHHKNPTVPIYLISDINPKLPFVRWEPLSQFVFSWQNFARSYIHLNTCAEWLTRVWFYRWFAIRELMRKYNLSQVVHLDTDILQMSSFDDFEMLLPPEKLAIGSSVGGPFSGHCAIIDSESILSNYLEFCQSMYDVPERIEILREFYYKQKETPYGGGICDMYAFGWASGWRGATDSHLQLFELNDPERHGIVFDQSITDNRTFSEKDYFVMKFGMKEIIYKEGWKFVRKRDSHLLPIATIHFQGTNKIKMRRFLEQSPLRFNWIYWNRWTVEQIRNAKYRFSSFGRRGIHAIKRRLYFLR